VVANADGSNSEMVAVTAVTGSTFTATFASSKTGPGITVVGAQAEQCDSLWLEECQIYLTHTGLLLSSWNSVQGSTFSNGSIGAVVRGVYVDNCGGLFTMQNVDGSLLDVPGLECAWIDIGGIHGPIHLLNCQCEAGYGKFLRVESGLLGIPAAITLQNCVADHEIDIRSPRNIVSIGNGYDRGFVLSGNDVMVFSLLDYFLDPTADGFAPYSKGTAAVTNGSNAVALTGGIWIDWFNRGTFSTDGGATNYVLTCAPPNISAVVGTNQATLHRPYTGATNPASAYAITAVPVRAFMQTGVNTRLVNYTPQPDSQLLLESNIEGLPALRLRAVPGADANPGIFLENGTQTWQILFPGATGIVPGGFALYDFLNAKCPVKVEPNSPTESLLLTTAGPLCNAAATGPGAILTTDATQTVTNKTIGPFAVTILNDDGLGNLPDTFPANAFYCLYVNNVAGFPATYGSVVGYSNALSGWTYSYQLFHDSGTNHLYLRTATSATAWGSWIDLTSVTLPAVGTAGTYTKVATNAAGRVTAGAAAASTDLSDSSSLVRVNGSGTYSGNGSGNILSILVGGTNPPAGMYRVSAYIYNTSTATGNLVVQVNYTNPGGITSGLQFLPAMGTASLGGVGGDTVIYTNGSPVNINVTISTGTMPTYTLAATMERLQ